MSTKSVDVITGITSNELTINEMMGEINRLMDDPFFSSGYSLAIKRCDQNMEIYKDEEDDEEFESMGFPHLKDFSEASTNAKEIGHTSEDAARLYRMGFGVGVICSVNTAQKKQLNEENSFLVGAFSMLNFMLALKDRGTLGSNPAEILMEFLSVMNNMSEETTDALLDNLDSVLNEIMGEMDDDED